MSVSKKVTKNMTVTKRDESNFRVNFSYFLKNEHRTFFVQKTEKLASALYIVTGFIPPDDPIKTRLRTCALDLVRVSTDSEKARDTKYHEGFGARCLEIASMLTLAQRAGFVSSMNVRILSDEYAELAMFVKNHREKVFGFKTVDVGDEEYPMPSSVSSELPDAAIKDIDDNKRHFKKTFNNKRHLSRKDKILSLLENKDKITVKDAINAIEGCSEKTIQRELIALVSDGVLIKEGERRWSTYRKAN